MNINIIEINCYTDFTMRSLSKLLNSYFSESENEGSWLQAQFRGKLTEVTLFIIWLAPRVGKVKRILCSDWLTEQARWAYLVHSGLPVLFLQKPIQEQILRSNIIYIYNCVELFRDGFMLLMLLITFLVINVNYLYPLF